MVPIDVTNAETPAAGGQLSGESAREAAIKRLRKFQESAGRQKKVPTAGSGAPPDGAYGAPPPLKG